MVRVVDLESLAPHCCGLESRQILSCEKDIQLAYGTSVVLLRCLLIPKIMHGGYMRSSSTSKAGKSRKIIVRAKVATQCWCVVKPNQKYIYISHISHKRIAKNNTNRYSSQNINIYMLIQDKIQRWYLEHNITRFLMV